MYPWIIGSHHQQRLSHTNSQSNIGNNTQNNAYLWHHCYERLDQSRLLYLLKANKVRGLTNFGTTHTCRACLTRRQCRKCFPKSSANWSSQVLHLIHFDLVGSIKILLFGGSWFFVVFIDAFKKKNEFISWNISLKPLPSSKNLKLI